VTCCCLLGVGTGSSDESKTTKIPRDLVVVVAALEPHVRHLGETSYYVVSLNSPDKEVENVIAQWNLECRYLWSALCSRSDQLTYEVTKMRRANAPMGTHVESIQQPVRGSPPLHHTFLHAHFSAYRGKPRYWCIRMRGDKCVYDTFWHHDDIKDRLPTDHPLLVAPPVLAIREIAWDKLSDRIANRIYYDVSRDDQKAVRRRERTVSASSPAPETKDIGFNTHLAAVLATYPRHDPPCAPTAFASFATLQTLTSSPDKGNGMTVCAAYSSTPISKPVSRPFPIRVVAASTVSLSPRVITTTTTSDASTQDVVSQLPDLALQLPMAGILPTARRLKTIVPKKARVKPLALQPTATKASAPALSSDIKRRRLPPDQLLQSNGGGDIPVPRKRTIEKTTGAIFFFVSVHVQRRSSHPTCDNLTCFFSCNSGRGNGHAGITIAITTHVSTKDHVKGSNKKDVQTRFRLNLRNAARTHSHFYILCVCRNVIDHGRTH
jgi:hypothetical protein